MTIAKMVPVSWIEAYSQEHANETADSLVIVSYGYLPMFIPYSDIMENKRYRIVAFANLLSKIESLSINNLNELWIAHTKQYTITPILCHVLRTQLCYTTSTYIQTSTLVRLQWATLWCTPIGKQILRCDLRQTETRHVCALLMHLHMHTHTRIHTIFDISNAYVVERSARRRVTRYSNRGWVIALTYMS